MLYTAGGLLCALALATSASGAGTATPGVSPTEIVIGGTVPMTGFAQAFKTVGLGASYYFKYVNAHGGVNHRKIKYILKDDQYDPAQTMSKTRELVEQDHVFAIFNSLGTEHNLATRPYLNAVGVPQLFVASGGTTFGKDYKQYKWTIGYQPNYRAEGTIYGRYVAKTAPKSSTRTTTTARTCSPGSVTASPRRRSWSSRSRATTPTTRTCSRRSRS